MLLTRDSTFTQWQIICDKIAKHFSITLIVKSKDFVTMRFSAKISTQEDRYDTNTSECISSYVSSTGYEMESIQCTVQLQPVPAVPVRLFLLTASVPNHRRKSGTRVAGSSSSTRTRKKRDANFTEEEELELCRIGLGMGYGETSQKKKEEEELRMKMMRKPSRKVSREGDFVLIQEISGIKMTQTGNQQIREERVLIGSEEYFYMLNKGLLKTTNDMG